MTEDQKKEAAAEALAEATGHYSNYAEYNKQLRTWLVSFGLGGPVLFFTNPDLLKSISLHEKKVIIWSFLIGCAFQVANGFLNKLISWQCYDYSDNRRQNPTSVRTNGESFWEWASKQYWIDWVLDLGTIVLFGFAVIKLAASALKA